MKVVTDGGVHGWGEATIEGRESTVQAAIAELGQLVVGEDPLAVEHDWQILHRRFWRGGVVLQTAIGALDQALWDIRGKAWGVPVYRLLGGPTRHRLRLYTHAGIYDPTAAEPEADQARRSGFTAIKTGAWVGDSVLPEREGVSVAVDRYERLRVQLGSGIDLLVDNHGRSRSSQASLLGKELAERGAFWLEEPTAPEDLDGLARVRAACPTLVLAAGERCYSKKDVLPLLERRLVDVVQPDLCHAGGITECKKIAALAETYGVDVAPHNPRGPVATAAAAHLALAIPNFLILEFVLGLGERSLAASGWVLRDGHLEVPELPGLGVELDEEELAANPARHGAPVRAYASDGSVADI
ncbi:MAG: galactonate dehydratase [Actinomycetota bacterium]|nr:galactonate dehydratase [Actinomycetota bacterium]